MPVPTHTYVRTFRFLAFLGGGFCYSVVSSRRYTPSPRAPCEPEVCVFPLRAVFFLALLMLTYFYFSPLPALFRFRLGHRLFHPVFFLRVLCCLLGFGFCCDSFSIRMICILIRMHADLTF